MIVGLFASLGLMGAYLLLAGDLTPDELAAAVLCGGLAALWWAAIRRASHRRFRFEAGALPVVARAPAGLPGATFRVGGALLRALFSSASGRTNRYSFVHGSRLDPADSGRRAVATLAASLSPNGIVLRLPEQEDVAVVHGLTDDGGPRDPRWLA